MNPRRIMFNFILSLIIGTISAAVMHAPVINAALSSGALLQTDVGNWSRLTYASYRNNNWEIYTALGDGTNETRLTFRTASDSTPKLNRGATQIVFASTAAGAPEIYTINVAGSGETRLTFTGKGEYLPDWSPDGSKIIFTSLRDGNYELYVMNADGFAQTRLTNNTVWDIHPAWSPDGQQIVFVSNRAGPYQLWLMNADGSNPTVVSAALDYVLYPSWSPDGSRIAFNDDENNDGTLDVAIINRDGTGLVHPLGYAPTNTDYRAPVWSPDGQQVAFAMIHRTDATNWDQARLYALTLATNNLRQMTTGNKEWWVDWETTDVTPPTSSVTTPMLADRPTFPVTWSGTDTQSGVRSYGLQVRDGLGGVWTPWLTATTQTTAMFNGELAHTYYFQSRATDWAGNVQAYPGGNGSAVATTPSYELRGQVRGHRDQPVAVALIQGGPPLTGSAFSDAWGDFNLYAHITGTAILTVSRAGFGSLPAMQMVSVGEASVQPVFYLPPPVDVVTNGQFESGDLSGWNVIGEMTPTITTTAHTGHYAVQLGGSGNGPGHSAITQVISWTPATTATLSLVYWPGEMEPVSTTLHLIVEGATDVLSTTAPLTGTGWQHIWLDVPPAFSPTFTLTVDLQTTDSGWLAPVNIDEVSFGAAEIGSYPVFLPVVALNSVY